MTTAIPDLWMTAQELALAGLPEIPDSKRLVNRMAEVHGWRDRAGAWRRRGGRGGAIEYHVSVLPAAALRALAARALKETDTQRIVAVEAAILFWTEGRGNKSQAVAEAATISGASQASIWRWWRQVEGMTRDERHAALSPVHGPIKAEASEAAASAASTDRSRQDGLAGYDQLSEKQQAVADGRMAILRMVDELCTSRGLKVSAARSAFIEGWEAGDDYGIPDALAAVGKVSLRSLERWASLLSTGGLAALAPRHGQHSKGSGVIDSNGDMKTLVEGMLAQFSELQITTIFEAIKARFADSQLPSKRTVQRWVADWKDANIAAYLHASDPDAYKNKARLVAGSASESVIRLNQLWQMDGTPNDVMLSDGKRHAIVGVLDVYTRRLRLVVTKTQTAAAVAACLRKGLMAWGVPEEIKMDNGSDYRSKHIERVCGALDITQDFCPAFSPEKKPHIERAFKTFSHGLVAIMPGFIGHSVDQRKKIEARKTFASRLMNREAAPPEINMTAAELQEFCDDWCASMYEHREHSTLDCSPFEKAQGWTGPIRAIENERALDMLLMAAPGDGGTRTVTKYGVRIERVNYTDPALQAHWGQRVQVRLDEEDWGRVLVLSDQGEFIAWAICPERSGVSRSEFAAYMAVDRKKIESEFRARMAKAKRESEASTVAADILASYKEKADKIVAFPAQTTPHTTDALDAAAIAAEAKGKPALVEKRTDVTSADILSLDVKRSAAPAETRKSRYLRWEAIDAAVREGEPVGEKDGQFWRAYSRSPEHASLTDFISRYGREAALGTEGNSGSAG